MIPEAIVTATSTVLQGSAMLPGGAFTLGSGKKLLVIFFASCLTNNIALAYFLGMCAFLALSRNIRTAFGMGLAVTFTTFLTTMVNWFVFHFLLAPLGLEFLHFLVFILVIAALVQFLEMFIDRFFPTLHEGFGIFLPLITVNCTVLAASLFMVIRKYGFWESATFSLGTGLGWLLAILLLAGIRQHLAFARPHRNLGPIGVSLLLAGIMAMAFAGFSGMVRL